MLKKKFILDTDKKCQADCIRWRKNMKKIILFILALTASVNLYANEKYSESKYFFTDTRLKLRESSNLSSKVITVLDDETCVLLLEEGISDTIDDMDDNWVKVKTIPQKGKNEKSSHR